MKWFYRAEGMKCYPFKGSTLMVFKNGSCAAFENARPSHNWEMSRREAGDALRMLRGIVKKGDKVSV